MMMLATSESLESFLLLKQLWLHFVIYYYLADKKNRCKKVESNNINLINSVFLYAIFATKAFGVICESSNEILHDCNIRIKLTAIWTYLFVSHVFLPFLDGPNQLLTREKYLFIDIVV